MNKLQSIPLSVLLILAIAFTAADCAIISGTVTNERTSRPVQGAVVTVSHNAVVVMNKKTDPSGYYSFDLPPGLYDITAAAKGYSTRTYADVSAIKDFETSNNIGLEPVLIGRVKGMVIISNNIPVKGAGIELSRYSVLVSSAETNANGEYALAAPAGKYDMKVFAADFSAVERADVQIDSNASKVEDFVLSYINDALVLEYGVFDFLQMERYPVQVQLKAAGSVKVKIMSITGKDIRKLFDGDMSAGQNTVYWDGRDERGAFPEAGTYFVYLKTESMNKIKTMLLVR